ncbi:hypothetical protein [Kitasatospora paranensis]|uniref:Adhesin domain-containing protein n=1 Tax=Kitasatospora paranensis TaxID=258053 RepID=A0ABW2FLU1_9ACTN
MTPTDPTPDRTPTRPTAPGPDRRSWRTAGAVVGAAVLAAAAAFVLTPGDPPGTPGQARTAPGVRPHALLLDGVAGRIEVTGTGGTTATADFVPEGSTRPGPVAFHPTGADGGLTLVCGTAGGAVAPCRGTLRVAVPAGTALTLHQSAGETVLSGLDGDLDVAVTSARLTAVGLRAPRAGITVDSASADLAFATAPGELALRAASASVALRLPDTAEGEAYAVTSDAVSADVRVAVPQTADPAHVLRLSTVSASVAVLPTG